MTGVQTCALPILTLSSSQRLCQQIRSTASKPLVSSRNMGRKNLTTRRTTDIAKILSNPPSPALRCVVRNDIARTLRTLSAILWARLSAAYAQSHKRVAQVVENGGEVESSKRLKIRVSVVRFRPRPPNKNRCLRKRATVFSLSHTAAHSSHIFWAGIDLRRCCDFASRCAGGWELLAQRARV